MSIFRHRGSHRSVRALRTDRGENRSTGVRRTETTPKTGVFLRRGVAVFDVQVRATSRAAALAWLLRDGLHRSNGWVALLRPVTDPWVDS